MQVDRPVEEVYSFLANTENWARLQPALREGEQTSHNPTEVGSTFRQTLDIPGRRIELLGKVTEYEPNERLSLEYAWDRLSLWISFIFEPADEGTELTARGEGSMDGFLGLFEPLVESEINIQLKTNLDNLKSLLEARGFLR